MPEEPKSIEQLPNKEAKEISAGPERALGTSPEALFENIERNATRATAEASIMPDTIADAIQRIEGDPDAVVAELNELTAEEAKLHGELITEIQAVLGIEHADVKEAGEATPLDVRFQLVLKELGKLLNLPQLEEGVHEIVDMTDSKTDVETLVIKLEDFHTNLLTELSTDGLLSDKVLMRASQDLHALVKQFETKKEDATEDGSAGDEEQDFTPQAKTQIVDSVDIKPVAPEEKRQLDREAAASTMIETIVTLSRRYGNDLSNPLVQMRRIMETRHPGITARVDREGNIVMGIANISGEGLSQQFAMIKRDDINLFEPLHTMTLDAYNVLRTPDFVIAPVHEEDLEALPTIEPVDGIKLAA